MRKLYLNVGDIAVVDLLDSYPQFVAEYFSRNKNHLAPSMPERKTEFYTQEFWQEQLSNYQLSFAAGRELRFALTDGDTVIGIISYDQIVKGPFQACYLGYSIDSEYQGKGLMREALSRTISHVVGELGLNRIMANYEPSNQRSGKLLKSLGFEREGYARKYLKLNGTWKDHILTSYISD
jgi:ribosomal-protein-alanine N-acetyltransferase